jgi:Fe2+ transport system protein FeoA
MRGNIDSFWAEAKRKLNALGAVEGAEFAVLETVPVTCTVLEDGRARYEWEFGVYVEVNL